MTFDRSQFIDQFRAETQERVQRLNLGFLDLEVNPDQPELLRELMREAHSIKGSSTMMGFPLIADITHRLEDWLENASEKKYKFGAEHFNLLFKSLDTIGRLVEEDSADGAGTSVTKKQVNKLVRDLDSKFSRAAKDGEGAAPTEEKPPEPEPSILAENEKSDQPSSQKEEKSIRVDIEKLDNLMDLSGELIIARTRLGDLVTSVSRKAAPLIESMPEMDTLLRELKNVDDNLDRLISRVKSEVMNSRLVPISQLFGIFPRTMRDLAARHEKEIRLEIRGGETELDKALANNLKDPIMHLVRNAVDHGIELPAVRVKNKKKAEGKVVLSASRQGDRVVIEVSDDGAGIDLANVKKQAVRMGITSAEEAEEMGSDGVKRLLFTPGFTTRKEVGKTSGRGVGLDVVWDMILKMKGSVEIESTPGRGMKFIIEVPFTLGIIGVLLVSLGNEILAIPTESIIETVRVDQDQISMVETREAITVRGLVIPLINLNDVFGINVKGIFEKKLISVVVASAGGVMVALQVDEFLGGIPVVSKPLGPPLNQQFFVSGATVLGTGRVSLILDVA